MSLAVQQYSVQPKDRIFVKSYGVLSFAWRMGKNVGKIANKNLNSKNSGKPFDHAVCFRCTSKWMIKNTAEATGDLTENKIADKITRVTQTSTKNNWKTNEDIFLPPELRHKIINDQRLKEENYWKLFFDLRLMWYNIMEYQKIINLLDDLTNQPSKFRAKNWVEINDESRRDYNDDDENKNDNNNDTNIKGQW